MDIITGDPGSGKTLLAVKLLCDKYFFWHNKDRAFYRKEDAKKYTIVTNIDDFKLPHMSLNELLKDMTFDKFFSKTYQDEFHQEHPHVVYVIDECQQYIDKYFRNRDVIFYFDYHRHYGDTVFLITQHITKICKDISILHDYEYRAVNRTFSMYGEFRYHLKNKGERVKGYSFRNARRYFDLYKSFSGDNKERRVNPVFVTLAIFFCLFLFLGWYFYHRITPSDEEIQSVQSRPVPPRPVHDSNQDKQISLSDIQLPVNQVYSVQISAWCERGDSLYMFQDPITNSMITPSEALYDVKKFSDGYYALMTLAQYVEMKKVSEYTGQSDSLNKYSYSDLIMSSSNNNYQNRSQSRGALSLSQ